MKKTKNKTERQKMMDKIRPWFSRFIRIRDCDEWGMCICITCGTRKHWKDGIHSGHFVHGLHFVEENEHAQCGGCNTYCAVGDKYALWMVQEYGRALTESLYRLKSNQKKHTIEELEEILKIYKDKAKKIAEEKDIEI